MNAWNRRRTSLWSLAVALACVLSLGGLWGCGSDEEAQCAQTSDCPEGSRCLFSRCQPNRPGVDSGDDDVTDGSTPQCTAGTAPAAGELVINEVLAAPDSSQDDVNCDGTPSSSDEFIEIVNATNRELLLDGVEVVYDGEVKHTLDGCMAPGAGMVLYNKVEPLCELTVRAEGANTAFSLTNSGKRLQLRLDGADLDAVDYPSLSGTSWTRVPDFTGEFQAHDTIPMVEARFSLGACVGGDALALGCQPPGVIVNPTDCDDATAPSTSGELLLNELHAAPNSNEDDVDCNGATSSSDEFIEIVNASDRKLLLDGVEVIYDGNLRHTFSGCIEPGRGLVLYTSSAEPACALGDTLPVVADSALSLANSGERLVSLMLGDAELDAFTYPAPTGNSSWTRFPDFGGEWVQHADVPGSTSRFSAGTCVSGAALAPGCALPSAAECGNATCEPGEDATSCPDDCTGDCGNGACDEGEDAATCPADCATTGCEGGVTPALGDLALNEIHAAPSSSEDDTNCDLDLSSTRDEFIEVVNTTSSPLDVAGVQLTVNGSVKHTLSACLPPGSGVVIYSGGEALCPDLGATVAQVSDGALGLTNSGATVTLLDAEGAEHDAHTYTSPSSNSSWTRAPDFTGDWTQHADVPGALTRFSAGKCISGEALQLGCALPGGDPVCGDELCEAPEDAASCPADCDAAPVCGDDLCEAPEDAASCPADCDGGPVCGDGACEAPEDLASCLQDCSTCGDGVCDASEDLASCLQDCSTCGDGVCDASEDGVSCPDDCGPACAGGPPAAGELVINEVHTSPDTNADDVNCDGVTSTNDEFIEVLNNTARELDLSGVELHENGAAQHTFSGCLAPGLAIVVYNKQLTPMCGAADWGDTVGVPSDASFTLTNGGGETLSLHLGAATLDTVTTPDLGATSPRASTTRSPDYTGPFITHSDASTAPYSPGTCVGGGFFPTCQ